MILYEIAADVNLPKRGLAWHELRRGMVRHCVCVYVYVLCVLQSASSPLLDAMFVLRS